MSILLNEEQQAILNGSKGETMAKVMKTMVKYGEIFGAERMVPVTSKYNHLVTSFGLKAMTAVYELMDQPDIETGDDWSGEAHFGIVNTHADYSPGEPKLAYHAVQQILLGGANDIS